MCLQFPVFPCSSLFLCDSHSATEVKHHQPSVVFRWIGGNLGTSGIVSIAETISSCYDSAINDLTIFLPSEKSYSAQVVSISLD